MSVLTEAEKEAAFAASVSDLLTYLENQGMAEPYACNVMLAAVYSLVPNEVTARLVVRHLAEKLDVSDELRVLQ